MGDGKAVLRSSVREAIASEAMFALGIPTTRAMALVHDTTQPVYRETVEHAAMVMRVAPSFLRPGHLEYWGRHGYTERLLPYLNVLYADYFGTPPEEGLAIEAVVRHIVLGFAILTGVLFAQWQAVGFCHGVLNTDNLSLLGLTLDYGPYGFMDAFDMRHICNHSDTSGRYSYNNQPAIGLWNLHRLLEALKPLFQEATAYTTLERDLETYYQDAFNTTFLTLYRQKLGLTNRTAHPDIPLGDTLKQLFSAMHASRVDYTRFFFALPQFSRAVEEGDEAKIHALLHRYPFLNAEEFSPLSHWLKEVYVPLIHAGAVQGVHPDTTANPVLVPRNYIAQELIELAEHADATTFTQAMAPLYTPYAQPLEDHPWAGLPPAEAATLCVSCSS
jgi:serine/tyrosine/threonine adenylyltransferase